MFIRVYNSKRDEWDIVNTEHIAWMHLGLGDSVTDPATGERLVKLDFWFGSEVNSDMSGEFPWLDDNYIDGETTMRLMKLAQGEKEG